MKEKQYQITKCSFGYNEERKSSMALILMLRRVGCASWSTGSGKATVMNLLNHFYDVTSGAVLLMH